MTWFHQVVSKLCTGVLKLTRVCPLSSTNTGFFHKANQQGGWPADCGSYT